MQETDKKTMSEREMFARLLVFVRPYTWRLVIGIVCGLLYGVATFGMLVALRLALGNISGDEISLSGVSDIANLAGATEEPGGSAGDMSLKRLLLTVSLLPLVTIIQGVVFFAGKYLVEWVGNRVVADLRDEFFEHLHNLPMQFYSENRVGDLIARITGDTRMLNQLVSNVIGDVIREPFTLLACIGAMIYMEWHLAVVSLVIFPVCILPVAILGRKVRKASKSGRESSSDMLSVVQESLTGALVVKAFQMEEEEVSRFKSFNRKVFKMQMRQSRSRSLNDPIVIFLSSIGIAGVVVYAYLNDVSLALLVAFAGAMLQMYKPAKKLSQIHLRVQRAAPGADRIFEVLDLPNAITDIQGATEFSGPVESVKFNNVSFAYDEAKILDNINLTANAGSCIAFVGSSGAGKTTIVNLLPRFYDVTEGCVELNGRDIRDYTLHSLRSQIGVVTQQTVLFNRSVADNISYGSRDATRGQIEDAARRANAHPFIMELEDGYDTIIGERGSRLSGGMAQRMAIARALLKNPPILILDEATSALDTESERLVQEALDELMKDRTVFVIAHRLSTIAHADSIVVLDKGKIVEVGTHDDLLTKSGKYKYLYDIQFGESNG